MATDQELQDSLAGIDIRDDEMSEDSDAKDAAAISNYAASITSSAESMQIEELKKKLVQSETEKFVSSSRCRRSKRFPLTSSSTRGS